MFFSVIVPIYKVEGYIRRCVNSVLNQTFGDFELILVDDGSPDKCPQICDEYAKKDARIKVIHKKNGGLVSARQAGIEAADGDYVFNLDSDDAITADAFESAYKIISSTDADIVSFAYKYYINGKPGEILSEPLDEGLYEKQDIEKYIFPKLLTDTNMQHIIYFLSGKAVRRTLLLSHQLNVSRSISLGEDLCCVVPCYLQAKKAYISKNPVYMYTVRNDSLTTSFTVTQIIQLAEVVETLRNTNIAKPDDFEQQLARYSCFMCFAILAAAAEGNHFEYIRDIKQLILNSVNKAEIAKAEFEHITVKSRISVFLIKHHYIRTAFYFLYLCNKLKHFISKKD